ncbi:MAG: outer membrane protein assembly factor BamE [Pseudomonadales bacterium]
MHKYVLTFIALTSSLLLASCSSLQFPGVYKITIEQGNVVTQEMVDQLKPGMSKEQVDYIMGSPLIKDSFNAERWDYVYSIQRGNNPKEQYRITIFFEEGSLKHFTGDFVPSSSIKETTREAES